jgi:hypothetical protein
MKILTPKMNAIKGIVKGYEEFFDSLEEEEFSENDFNCISEQTYSLIKYILNFKNDK